MAYPFYQNYNAGYQQPMYQPVQDQLQQLRNQPQQQMIPQQMQGPVDDRIFVQGELAAQAYLVAPNSFVRLWDSQANTFYEKRADASGRPYMEVFDYQKRDNSTSERFSEKRQTVDYESEIKALKKRIEALETMKGVVANDSKSDSDDSII